MDPDHRQPVDCELRRCLFNKARTTAPAELMRARAIKLLVTERALHFRREHRDLFSEGGDLPLRAIGDRQYHVIASPGWEAGIRRSQ